MPDWKQEIRQRLANLKVESGREADIVDELAQYLEDCYEELLGDGVTPSEAASRVLKELSGSAFLAQELRREKRQRKQERMILGTNRRIIMLQDLWQDLRLGARMSINKSTLAFLLDTVRGDVCFALRGLAKRPLFTAVCVVTLALAIGANSAIFSVVNAVLIRPLPYPDAEQLVQVWETNPRANRWGDWASYPDFVDWNRENRVFDAMAAFRYRSFRLTGGQQPEMLVGLHVSPALLQVLRVNPILGRSFLAEEGSDGRNQVVIVSYGLWQRQFGSDSGLVNKSITIDGRSHMVVGVMPPGLRFPANLQGTGRIPDVWIPVSGDRDRGSHNYQVIARLKPDRTIREAQTEMDRLAQFVAQLDPGHRGRGAAVAELQDHTTTAVRPALFVLAGATLLVLLIACANVASLVLARGAARTKETALRLALGAGTARVLQQGLTESLVLALSGGVAGILVAFAGVRFLVALGPAAPLVREASIDLRVLIFTLLIALTAGVAFGLAPAFKALKVQPNEALQKTGGKHTGSVVQSRMRSILTVAEVALALMLLIGAGLLMRSFLQLRVVDAGFEAENLLTAFLRVPPDASSNSDRIVTLFEDVIARIERIPGVKGAAGASAVPLLGNESSPFRVEGGLSVDRGQELVYAEQPKITPSYFRTMGIRLVRGREFTRLDTTRSQPVAVVSESLANTYWPGDEAIGKRLIIDDRQWRTVVGIAKDVRHDGLDRPPRPTIYIPLAQYSRPMLTLLIRTDSNPAQYIGSTREAVAEVEKNQPLFGIQTMEQTLGESISLRRFLLMLIGIFAAIALVLGIVGVYGLLAYFVSHRKREIGIRIALGAKRSEVGWLIVKQAAVLGLTGVGIGVVGALALSRTLSGMLFGVSPTDIWTFTVAPMLLFLIVLLASFLPGRAATRVDPIIALRGE